MWKFDKINYSKRKTLSNLWEWYSFELKNKVTALWIKEGTFKKWDIITIKKIILKNDKPHHVCIEVIRDSKAINEINMSWWVFLNNFINNINRTDIIEKDIDKTKSKIDTIIKKED